MATLELLAVDVRGPLSWRWLLVDADDGAPLADQTVHLDPHEGEYEAFIDPLRYVRWNADPDRRTASGAAILDSIGSWIGDRIFGAVGVAMLQHKEAAVRIRIPPEADFLLYRPLELAVVNGQRLTEQVSFMFDPGTRPTALEKQPATGQLRVLIACGLPAPGQGLPGVRERRALIEVCERLAHRGAPIEYRLLKEGMTLEELAAALEDGGGWDVVHISGHGSSRERSFVLLNSSGGTSILSTVDLASLLRPTRSRLKFAFVSACQPAEIGAAESYGLRMSTGWDAERSPLLMTARELVRRLDCVVLTTRQPIPDDTLAAFLAPMYESLLGWQATPAAALRLATRDAWTKERMDLAFAGLMLVGRDADRVTLAVRDPRSLALPASARTRLVGRVSELARASAGLAAGSETRVVVLHGMPGVGKSAVAQELVDRHQTAFERVVRWSPNGGSGKELASLGAALTAQLPGFPAPAAYDQDLDVRRLTVALRALLDERALLLVLDDLDGLLDDDGHWRTPHWATLFTACNRVRGLSRTIVTSRVPPRGTDRPTLLVPIHPLPAEDATAFASDLPYLGRLRYGIREGVLSPLGGGPETTPWESVVRFSAGNPRLLQFADTVAADPHHLANRLATADSASRPDAPIRIFFRGDGRDHEGFLEALDAWTASRVRCLRDSARQLIRILCWLEEPDRNALVLEPNWVDIWRRLDEHGEAPDLSATLAEVVDSALVRPEPSTEDGMIQYVVHPWVAHIVSSASPAIVRGAVDMELAAFWSSVAIHAVRRPEGEMSSVVVRAGLAAAPYLLHQELWYDAVQLLDNVLIRDSTPAVVNAALRYLRQIADARPSGRNAALLARALRSVDAPEAETLLRTTLQEAEAGVDHELASEVAGELVMLLCDTGRLSEALDLLAQKAVHTQSAGLGPWTQLSDDCQRLRVLYRLGRAEQVLGDVAGLLERMTQLPDGNMARELTPPWATREAILDVGARAAESLNRWREALDLLDRIVASRQQRGAPEHEVASARFNEYGPLLALGRLDEAQSILLGCQQSFEAHGDVRGLSRVLTARAELESRRGHLPGALSLERVALRLKYTVMEPSTIATSHRRLADYLAGVDNDTSEATAHRLAAAVIYFVTGMAADADGVMRGIARDIYAQPEASIPTSVAELANLVGRSDGVRFADLIRVLVGGSEAADAALAGVIAAVREIEPEDAFEVRRHLAAWEPQIAAVVAAAQGDRMAAGLAELFLNSVADTFDWGALVVMLRRILAGQRDQAALLAGLDPIDRAIVARTLDALAGRVRLTAAPTDLNLERAEVLKAVVAGVAAAAQDERATEAISSVLGWMSADPNYARLAGALDRILAGARDPEQLVEGLEPLDKQVVRAVLDQLEQPRPRHDQMNPGEDR